MSDRLKKLAIINEQIISEIPKDFQSRTQLISWLENSPYSPYISLYGGVNAKEFDEAKSFVGNVDEKKRFTIEDKFTFKFENFLNFGENIKSANTKLSNIINQKELFRNYPEFTDIDVSINISNSDKNLASGSFNINKNSIEIFADNNSSAMRVLLHELQHAIQFKEEFALGKSYYNEDGIVDMFVGTNKSKSNDYREGTFSDIATKTTLSEIDDSNAKLKEYTFTLKDAFEDYREKAFINAGDGISQDIFEKIRGFENYSEDKFFEEYNDYIERIKKIFADKEIEDVYDNVKPLIDEKSPYDTMSNLMKMRKYGKLENFLEHDELFKKYPELKNVHIKFDEIGDTNAMYITEKDYRKEQIILSDKFFNSEHLKNDMLSTLLHEIQHKIQSLEDWARGGNVEEFNKNNYDKNTLFRDKSKDYIFNSFEKNKQRNKIPKTATLSDFKKYLTENNIDNIFDGAIEDIEEIESTPFENYQKLWGEQQSRAVQFRANMSKEERISESWTDTLKRFEGYYKDPIIKYSNSDAYNLEVQKEQRDNSFKKWFKDSKVTDENGEALVLYHGTGADFGIFDKNKIGSIFGEDKEGFFFTNLKGDDGASGYADVAHSYNGKGNIMPVYVSLKNPLTLDIVARWYEYSSGQEMLEDYDTSLIDFIDNKKELVKYALEDGYDGIFFEDTNKDARYSVLEEEAEKWKKSGEFPSFNNNCAERLVVAFEPNQIKSIHNKGTFDINNPNILEKNDLGLRQIEKMLSIIPNKTPVSDVKSYLNFNGVTHENIRGSIYQNALNGNEFDSSIVKINRDIDTSTDYFKAAGEIESREIEEVYQNKLDYISTEELFAEPSNMDRENAMKELGKSLKLDYK